MTFTIGDVFAEQDDLRVLLHGLMIFRDGEPSPEARPTP
jgi:hypothetical protein